MIPFENEMLKFKNIIVPDPWAIGDDCVIETWREAMLTVKKRLELLAHDIELECLCDYVEPPCSCHAEAERLREFIRKELT